MFIILRYREKSHTQIFGIAPLYLVEQRKRRRNFIYEAGFSFGEGIFGISEFFRVRDFEKELAFLCRNRCFFRVPLEQAENV